MIYAVPIEDVPFIEYPTIRFNESESVEMPFRYVKNEQGEPILPIGMKKLLFDDMDKAFE
jgi:ribosome biogenesis SPOUT family RNA methylase Rps3